MATKTTNANQQSRRPCQVVAGTGGSGSWRNPFRANAIKLVMILMIGDSSGDVPPSLIPRSKLAAVWIRLMLVADRIISMLQIWVEV